MTTSVLSPARPALPPLPDSVFRRRLESVRDRLASLEGCCPPGHGAGVADALEALEWELASLGRHYPEPPLTQHDQEVLAALGCPA